MKPETFALNCMLVFTRHQPSSSLLLFWLFSLRAFFLSGSRRYSNELECDYQLILFGPCWWYKPLHRFIIEKFCDSGHLQPQANAFATNEFKWFFLLAMALNTMNGSTFLSFFIFFLSRMSLMLSILLLPKLKMHMTHSGRPLPATTDHDHKYRNSQIIMFDWV